MQLRMKKEKLDHTLTRGPGNVAKSLGLHVAHTGISLRSDELFIADDGFRYKKTEIKTSPRIGVDYAGHWARRLLRFYIKGNPFVSRR